MRFAKGHGTGNDFIILPDVGDQLELSARLVRRLCDRRTGIGADGVLRVVGARPDSARPDSARSGGASDSPLASWFMDYRNADGSIAEMCGNGIRVFARYLIGAGLAVGPEVAIGTRAGTRVVREEPDGMFSVAMGPVTTGRSSWTVLGGRRLPGLTVQVGNPHLVCVVDDPVATFDLSLPPEVDAVAFPDGVNVEVARPTGVRTIEMRVRERGSGETWSCGTGAVAAAAAAAVAAGEWPGRAAPWTVSVPGGLLTVLAGAESSVLTGPAVIVAEGEVDESWLTEAAAFAATSG